MLIKRQLGQTDLRVTLPGFGAWQVGGAYQIAGKPSGVPGGDENARIKLLQKARSLGINFFETSNVYGESENIIGKAFGASDEVIIASKCGISPENGKFNFSSDFIRASLDDSLKKLRRETIDLYQLTVPSFKELDTDIEDVAEILNNCKNMGEIRYTGISLKTPEDAEIVIKKHLFDVLQLEYNLFTVTNREVIREAYKNGVGVIVKSPLNKGMLTGKYDNNSSFPEDDFRSLYLKNEILAGRNKWLEKFCEKFKIPREDLTKTALRFVACNPFISTLALGMSTEKQLEENIRLFSEMEFFSENTIQEIENFSLNNFYLTGGVIWNWKRKNE